MLIEMLVVLAGVAMAPADLRQEVICAETGFSRSAENRDREAFLSFLHADARFVSGRVSRGRAAVVDAWSPVLSGTGPAIRWRPMVVEVTEDGLLALSRGPFRTVQVDEEGNSIETWGHFNSVWQRGEDGRWRVLFDVGGDVGMTPTDEEIAALEAEPDCP